MIYQLSFDINIYILVFIMGLTKNNHNIVEPTNNSSLING